MFNVLKYEQKALELFEQSEEVIGENQADAALSRVALGMEHDLAGKLPILITVMGGAVMFAGRLLPLLGFPLESDQACITRHGPREKGGKIVWQAEPRTSVHGRTVVLLDDLLDRGQTLACLKKHFLEQGAFEVKVAVWFDKTSKAAQRQIQADWAGAPLPERFVFGCGMDIEGYWRNLPSVRMLSF